MSLKVQSLCFSYDNTVDVMTDVTFDFSRGQVTGLLGANGSGKSTLFKLLLGILKPQQGQVLWQDDALSYAKKALLCHRQRVTMVFQEPDHQLFYTNVYDDIAFALRNLRVDEAEIEQRVHRALALVGGTGLQEKPIQYLSYGQKKRIAIAGALVMDSDYILLDEPTAGLDPEGRQQMIKLVKAISARHKRVVISSHDIDFIYEVCDYLCVLSHGNVLRQGPPESVFLDELLLARAGLVQPWLVKMHTKLGFPLCKYEQELFSAPQPIAGA